ncbi:MAG: hypothetical protein JXO22_02310, partial [Phycisphaerae bacterium]|nr:hypothetical protein [Phycisphaerae bacterium]
RTLTGATAAVGATLCRIGIYSVDAGTGDLTLVASTANDTALWIAANTAYTKALSASFSKTAGSQYAVGVLCVGASTAPTMVGQSAIAATEAALSPRLSGLVSGQTDLPSNITAGSVAASSNIPYAVLTP